METKPLDLAQFEGHTPGPWYSFGPYITTGGSDHNRIAEISRFGAWVGPEKSTPYGIDNKGWQSNQRLVIAAPALLAEARRLQAENERLKSAAEWFIADYEAKVAAGSTSAQNFSHAISLARAALKGA